MTSPIIHPSQRKNPEPSQKHHINSIQCCLLSCSLFNIVINLVIAHARPRLRSRMMVVMLRRRIEVARGASVDDRLAHSSSSSHHTGSLRRHRDKGSRNVVAGTETTTLGSGRRTTRRRHPGRRHVRLLSDEVSTSGGRRNRRHRTADDRGSGSGGSRSDVLCGSTLVLVLFEVEGILLVHRTAVKEADLIVSVVERVIALLVTKGLVCEKEIPVSATNLIPRQRPVLSPIK